jgi:hypothetical protein
MLIQEQIKKLYNSKYIIFTYLSIIGLDLILTDKCLRALGEELNFLKQVLLPVIVTQDCINSFVVPQNIISRSKRKVTFVNDHPI